ncbi:MAG: hypothetical protein FD177_1162 [Desulfovibrionaceae bacterium]|nr:MAG: hypothetical protein FD177_1162 [Desulfovibrionaceae bacterium]
MNKGLLATEMLIKKDQVAAVVESATSGNTLAIKDKMAKIRPPSLSTARRS